MLSSELAAEIVDHFASFPSDSMSSPNPSNEDGIVLHLERSNSDVTTASSWPPGFWERNFFPVKRQYFSENLSVSDSVFRRLKEHVFRYCVIADTLWAQDDPQEPPYPIAGLTLGIRGLNFVIGLGRSLHNKNSLPGGSQWTQKQTLLHELGHSIGLRHGGDSNYPFKPNYHSVMSYLWGGGFSDDWRIRNGPSEYQTLLRQALKRDSLVEARGIGLSVGDTSIVWTRARRDPPGVPLHSVHRPDTTQGWLAYDWNKDGDTLDTVTTGVSLVGLTQWPDASVVPWTSPNDVRQLTLEFPKRDSASARFDLEVREISEYTLDLLDPRACDCNRNLIWDETDIREGRSADEDSNAIPDECERPRLTGLPSRLLACPGGDGASLEFSIDFENLCAYDQILDKGSFFAVLRRGTGSTVRRWVEAALNGSSSVVVEDDTLWSDQIAGAHFGAVPARLSGAGDVWFDIYSGSEKWFQTGVVAIVSVDCDSSVQCAVDKFDRATLNANLGTGDPSRFDFSGDGQVTTGDLSILDAHAGHSFADPGVHNLSGTYPWGSFLTLLWPRGMGDSAKVSLKLGRFSTGTETLEAANIVDGGSHVWAAYPTDAPRSDYYMKLVRTAGVWDGDNDYGGVDFLTSFGVEGAQGGCPTVDVLTHSGWQKENTILGRSLLGQASLDDYRIKLLPDTTSGQIAIRVRENEQEYTRLRDVRLIAVDHPESVRAYSFRGRVLLGVPLPATRVTKSTGEDLTSVLTGQHGEFLGEPGDTLLVEFSDPVYGMDRGLEALGRSQANDGGGGGIIIDDGGGKEPPSPIQASGRVSTPTEQTSTDARILGTTGLVVEVPDEAGNWSAIARHYPRERPDVALVDTSYHASARLIFVGRHSLRFVGRILRSDAQFVARKLPMTSAWHTLDGDVSDALSGSGNLEVALAPGDTVNLRFGNAPLDSGHVRELFLLTDGLYSSDLPARLVPATQPTQFGLEVPTPNPFGSGTRIYFSVPAESKIALEILDVQGRRVRTLVRGNVEPGRHSIDWDRRSDGGQVVSAGVYFLRLIGPAGASVRRRLVVVN